MGSYLALRGIVPDLILSASSLRAQRTADELASRLDYEGRIHYLKELYRVFPETVLEVLSLQDDDCSELFVIAHNPELSEIANLLTQDHFGKIPALGIISIRFDIDNWAELLENTKGETDFFIYPKQFHYYMPKQIRATLERA